MDNEYLKVETKIKHILSRAADVSSSESLFTDQHGILLLDEGLELAKKINDTNYIYLFHALIAGTHHFHGDSHRTLLEILWCFENMTDEIFENHESKYKYNNHTMAYMTLFLASYIVAFTCMSSISKKDLVKLLENSKNYQLRYGETLEEYYDAKLDFIRLGIIDGDIDECYASWKKFPKSLLKYDKLYEYHPEIVYFLFKDDYKRAMKLFDNMLALEISSINLPQGTYARVLLYCLEKKDYERSDLYNLVNYPKIKNNTNFILALSEHILYTAHRDVKKAIPMFVDNILVLETNSDDWDKMFACAASHLLFRELLKKDIKTIKLLIDKNSKIYNQTDEYDVKKLMNYYGHDMEQLKLAFDNRNGNKVVSNIINRHININYK